MVIAVNTRILLYSYLEGYGNFVFNCFKRLSVQHPEHKFIFIFDRAYDPAFIFSDNIIPVILSPETRHPFLWWIWFNIKLPIVLKKYKADVFVSVDGFCSLNTKVPQCLLVHDLAFLHFPKFIKRSQYLFYKRFTPLFLKKAKTIVTVSEFSKLDIQKQYGLNEGSIEVVFNGVSEQFIPIDFEEKAIIKERYSDGKEYFLYIGAIHPRKNLVNLLKAFSVFKKKQMSNMQLLIAGRLAWQHEQFTILLNSYKYKTDVKLLGYVDLSLLTKLTASAYALVYPSLFEGFGVPPLEAMNCNVPVLASNASSIPEVCGDAILYFNPLDHLDMADKMMQIFKDEKLREQFIIKGAERVKQYSWDKTSGLLWNSILKTVFPKPPTFIKY